MSTIPDEIHIETWGASVQDVKDLLPHLFPSEVPEGSNPRYTQTFDTHPAVPDAKIERFMERAAARVNPRLPDPAQVTPGVRDELVVLARDIVSTGAAHIIQTSEFTSASDINDAEAYATQLWARLEGMLEDAAALIDGGGDTPTTGVLYSFPASPFPDPWVL